MTTSELELKTKRFTAKMSNRELRKAHEIIEDMLDVRAYDSAHKRLAASGGKTVPGEEVEAYLVKKFGAKFKQLLTT